jgi:hypothetical protein
MLQPMEIRATGLALGFAMLNAIIILLVQVTPIAIAAISWRYFLIFVFMDAIFIIVVYWKFPETANVPLEEVAALFGDEVGHSTIVHCGFLANVLDLRLRLRSTMPLS